MIEIVAQWVQNRATSGGIFSSALFCLGLSLASLLPLLDLPPPSPQTAVVVEAAGTIPVADPS